MTSNLTAFFLDREDNIWFEEDAFGEVEVVLEMVDYSSYGLCGVFVFFCYKNSHFSIFHHEGHEGHEKLQDHSFYAMFQVLDVEIYQEAN